MAAKMSDMRTIKWIYKKSRDQRLSMLTLILCNMIYAASSAFFALSCRGIIDNAVNGRKEGIIRFGLYLTGIILLQLILRLFLNSMQEYICSRLAMTFRRETLHEILQKKYAPISEYHSGELLNRMFSDVTVVTDGITNILPGLASMLTQLVSAMIVMVTLEPLFAIIFAAAGIIMFFLTAFFRGKLKYLHKEVQEKEGQVRSFLQETLESILVVKVFGADQRMEQTAEELQSGFFHAQMKRRLYAIGANAGFGFIFQMGYFFVIMWGAFGLFLNTMTYGTLTAMLQLVGQVQAPFANLSGFIPKVYSMLASSERIMELEKLENEKPAECVVDRSTLYESLEGICFRDICFSYGRNQVLQTVNLQIQKGDIIAVTGLSGGGKSTLFLLMMGAYEATSGSILFEMNEKEPRTYHTGRETRVLFAYVPQGNYLFSGTVRENIAFLKEDAKEAELWEAARIACAENFIGELPDGMNTKIGEKGLGLSEGQVQRLAVARAILSGAPILLLDEATSALDEVTEARLLKNIASLSKRTCLIVTHRKAALDICSKQIQILKEGNVCMKNIPMNLI